ncbi:HIT domain-containing protein [candidate division KSB1 bacterium]|nr:HIT domain-containing protein [candidate division KSB1 bacterium]
MDMLWAPWRIDYILQPKGDGCIFCDKPAEHDDQANLIPFRGETCYVIMNYYPYNNGHVMVVPYRHTSDLTSLSQDEYLEMMNLVSKSIQVINKALNPHGFNIGMNLGSVAGAGVKDHLHFHVVPRWNGDMNFMPVVGHTKVISEALEETCKKLKRYYES